MRIKNVTVRFDADEKVELKRSDLEASEDANLKELAKADLPGTSPVADGDGWVTSEEMLGARGLNVGAHYSYKDMRESARLQRHAGHSIVDLRAAQSAGESISGIPPAPLEAPAGGLAELPRSAFVPLAEYLVTRFAAAASYDSYYGEPGDKIYHFDGDDIVAKYSMHEIKAALAVLSAREGGLEFGLTRDDEGHFHFIQGKADKVEMDEGITGFDSVFHTHPKEGARMAYPSRGDLQMARALDPDHRGGAVTEDGWFTEYESGPGGQGNTEPKRLWKAQRFPLADEVVGDPVIDPVIDPAVVSAQDAVALRASIDGLHQGHLRAQLFGEAREILSQELVGLKDRECEAVLGAPTLRAMFSPITVVGQLENAVRLLGERLSPPLDSLLAAMVDQPDQLFLLQQLDELTVASGGDGAAGLIAADEEVTISVGPLKASYPVDGELADRLNIGSAVRRAVDLMVDSDGRSRYRYEHQPRLNPEFFTLSRVGTMELKPGQSASAALRDLMEHPEHAGFECAMAMTVVQHLGAYLSYRDRFGDQADARFDEDFREMRIGPQEWTEAIQFSESDAGAGAPPLPGDHLYFMNPGVDPVGFSRGRQGENVILVEPGIEGARPGSPYTARYFGHPYGLATGAEIVTSLEGERFNIHIGYDRPRQTLREACASLRQNANVPESLVRGLEELVSRLDETRAKRDAFANTRRDLMTEINNSYWDVSYHESRWASGEPRTEIDEQRCARSRAKIKQAEEDIAAGDREIDTHDQRSWEMAVELRQAAWSALQGLPTTDGAAATLKKVVGTLDGLEPREVTLKPTIRTMHLPE